MGSARWASAMLAFLGVLAITLASSGCGQPKCLDCGGDDPCPSFMDAAFTCEQVASMDTCLSYYLLEGPTWIQVSGQNGNEFIIEKTTTVGDWYTYEGELCNSKEDGDTRYYPFWGKRNIDSETGIETVVYSLNGRITAEAGVPVSMDATITLSVFDDNSSQASCTLTGSVTCSVD